MAFAKPLPASSQFGEPAARSADAGARGKTLMRTWATALLILLKGCADRDPFVDDVAGNGSSYLR